MCKQNKYFKKISGEKVYLSPVNPDDYEIFGTWINDLSISCGTGGSSGNYSLAKEKETLEKLASEGHNYAIIDNSDNTVLGISSLFDIDHLHRKAEMGIFIGDKNNHNKGYGKEAIELILSYGFKVLNLHNIMLKVFSFNKNAIEAYKKSGFNEFGRRHESFQINGKLYDDVYMEILRKDFHSPYLNDQLPS
ncbi:MAG: GNAT family protein [Spirochaetaceae bacterium]|jgi:RimJ/RimL family protein N-acetyltransferase|nr:GNAT family protein [Spirochaetaceae bacterium]